MSYFNILPVELTTMIIDQSIINGSYWEISLTCSVFNHTANSRVYAVHRDNWAAFIRCGESYLNANTQIVYANFMDSKMRFELKSGKIKFNKSFGWCIKRFDDIIYVYSIAVPRGACRWYHYQLPHENIDKWGVQYFVNNTTMSNTEFIKFLAKLIDNLFPPARGIFSGISISFDIKPRIIYGP